jgi:alpha-beta hydrolase superfamily lysophospholipase
MPNILDWVGERLKKISQTEFTNNVSHRWPKLKKNFQLVQEYYSVPLASGCGTAVLTVATADKQSTEFKPLIILFHALGQDSVSPFWHWINELASNGIAVLSVDWDGHGAGSYSLLDLQEATRSIPLIIQRLYGEDGGTGLNAPRNGPKCFLMGYSFGASLSLIASTREDIKKHIYGIIAVSPVLQVQSFMNKLKEVRSFFTPRAWFSDFANKFFYYGIWGLLPAYGSFKRKYFPIRLKLDIDYTQQAREFVHETFENRKILKKVNAPVLWIHGFNDHVSSYSKTSKLMMEIRSAFFTVCDESRGHLRMVFNDKIINYSIKFINNNEKYYLKK